MNKLEMLIKFCSSYLAIDRASVLSRMRLILLISIFEVSRTHHWEGKKKKKNISNYFKILQMKLITVL